MELESQLISRVRSGDREALAEFVQRYEPLIRARFREQFASAPRGVFDTSDFFATVIRRADAVMGNASPSGGMESPGEMLSRIMRSAASDYARSLHADQRAYRSRFPAVPDAARTQSDTDEEKSAVSRLEATDSQIFRLRALGIEHRIVGVTLGMSESTVRMRWHRILNRLHRLARHA